MFSQTNTKRVSFDIQKNKIPYIQWSIQTLNVCKRRLNNINITLNITLPKRGNGADFNTNMLVVDTNRFAELHPIEKRHLRSHSHSFAQFFYVCVHVLVLLIFLNRRRAQLSCRLKAAEPIVFHYIIRAKLFPKSSKRYLCLDIRHRD